MYNLQTKAQRTAYQAAQIANETAKGATVETYKDLKIVTRDERDPREYYRLMIFRGDAGHPVKNEYYRSEEARARTIETMKASTDRRETYKAEQKAKGRQLTGSAQAAAAIREELKTKFKGVKFSVTSDNFSMGNSVSITWTDGPTEDEVSAITSKYQYGHFNGMEDLYEYSNSREDIPQAKYVSEHRKQSEETRKAIEAAALQLWPGEDFDATRYREQQARELFNNTPLPIGAKVTGIQRGDETNRYKDRLIYTAPDQPSQEERPEPVEVPAGTVQIIDYSDKAIAIVSAENLAHILGRDGLGLKFNKYLTCGPAWIAPKSRLEEITKALQALKKPAPVQAPEPEEIPEEPTPEEARQIEEEKRFNEMAEHSEEPNFYIPEKATPAPLQEETAKNYDTLEEIEEAANSGEVISLYNLHELVNKKKPAAQAMREAATKLNTMADEHSAHMEKVRAEIAEEVQKIKEIGTTPAQIPGTNINEDEAKDKKFIESLPDVPEGYTLNEHPETPSGYLTREEVKRYNTPASIEARRIESDQRKAGKTNTALPAPQMFINF